MLVPRVDGAKIIPKSMADSIARKALWIALAVALPYVITFT
jgi:hypothetical protein